MIKKDGTYETKLHKWMTEGQGTNAETNHKKPYSLVNIGIPFGAGIRYGLNKNVTISAEVDYYYFVTDYLDDVSDRYATYDELAADFQDPREYEIAKYICDPTGKGSTGEIGPTTSPRGNPKLKDAYTFVSLEIAYKLTIRPKSIYGQLAKN